MYSRRMALEGVGASRRRRKRWLPDRLSSAARREIITDIVGGATATTRFFVLLALSTVIASFGLLSNSAAVIIGAMIVAPLMGPILGMAMGMVTGRQKLERGALLAEVTGVAMAVGLGYLVGRLPLNLGISAEMLGRTSPTLYDLFIAFASGLAGGYVSVNRSVNSALAGVAISVALVPPLATCGLLLAVDHRREALGAFLLFAANFFSIQLAAAFVFSLFGFARASRRHFGSIWPFVMRFLPGLVAMGLMAWGMTGTLVGLVRDHNEEETIRKTLNEEIARRSGGRLEAILSREEREGRTEVVASALTPEVFEPAQVAQIERVLGEKLGGEVRLVLRSLVSQDVDDHGRVYVSTQEREQSQAAKDSAEYLARASEVLRRRLAQTVGAELDGLDRRDRDGRAVLMALVRTPVAVDSDLVATMENDLRDDLGGDPRLIVRNVLTQDADRTGFLYRAQPEETPPPDPSVERLRARVEGVLARRMARQPARSLVELRVVPVGGGLAARATVRATRPVRPSEVRAIEADLRRFVDARLRLSVRTRLEAEASAGGWRKGPGP